MTAVVASASSIEANAGPSSEPVWTALVAAIESFTSALSQLSSSLRTKWTAGEVSFEDAQASITALSDPTDLLKSALQRSLTSADESTTNTTWVTFREIAASQVRLELANTLGNVVSLTEDDQLTVYAHLDVVTSLQEFDVIDGAVALQLIEEIMERVTVDSACTVFGYLESRVSYLTRDLSPSRGKGLVLLRLLNDLLRRLSKPSRSHLVLSGRILSLLSSVFPLGERSGVNLRGEFNTGNTTKLEDAVEESEQVEMNSSVAEEEEVDKDADPSVLAARDDSFYRTFWSMQQYFSNPTLLFASRQDEAASTVDKTATPRDGTPRPTEVGKEGTTKVAAESGRQSSGILSGNVTPRRAGDNEEGDVTTSTSRSQTPAPIASPLQEFRTGTRRIFDVFAEASSREREVELAERAASKGGSSASNKKRKREEMLQNHAGADAHQAWKEGENEEEGAFPKYLTGRRVFEYQLRSPSFRRHILLQHLILFQYLLAFNPVQKEKSSEWKNKQLLLAYPLAAEFVLAEDDELWIRKSWKEVVALLEDTGPTEEGRKFKNSALQTLRRESRWIHWKADNCPPIDKPGLDESLVEKYRISIKKVLRPRSSYPHIMGTPALSELWEQGLEPIVPGKRRTEDEEGMEVEIDTDGLEQLELAPGIPSVTSYVKQLKQQEARAEMRRKKLGLAVLNEGASEEERVAFEKKRETLEKTDEELLLLQERKTSLNWRALRIARASTLGLWGKIGGGDVELLLKAEKEEEEAMMKKKKSDAAAAVATSAASRDSAAAVGNTDKVAPVAAIADASEKMNGVLPTVEEAKQEELVDVPEEVQGGTVEGLAEEREEHGDVAAAVVADTEIGGNTSGATNGTQTESIPTFGAKEEDKGEAQADGEALMEPGMNAEGENGSQDVAMAHN